MYQSIVLFIGLRFFSKKNIDSFNKLMSWSASIGISISIAAFILILSVMNGYKKELKKNILSFIPHVLITNNKNSINPKKDILNHFLNSNINNIETLTIADIIVQSKYNIAYGSMLGIQPKIKNPITPYIVHSKQNNLETKKHRIILGKQLAKKLNVKIGDKIRLIMPNLHQKDIINIFSNQKLFSVIDTFFTNTEVDEYQLLINQEDASEMLHYPKGNVTAWRLWLNNPLNINIKDKKILSSNMIWKDWREKKGELFQAIEMEKKMISLLLTLLSIVAIFNIVSALSLLVFEKKKEIAILMTYGMTKYQIIKIFILQSLILGMVGIFFGVLSGIILTNCLNIFFPNINFPIEFSIVQILTIAIITMITILMTTFYPTYYASIINPSEALSYE